MTVEITILGLGQIGTSIGLALQGREDILYRRGYDNELGTARQAQSRGAVDKVHINIPNAVSNADVVLLTLPMSEIRPMLQTIAADLKEDAVVMDTSPVKQAVSGWVKELLPPGRHYVGLTPVLHPDFLFSQDSGMQAASADLFHDTPMLIAAPPGTPSQAVKLAADLTRLLGAVPLFAELVEVDSLMASTHILPQLLSAALINATVDQPGWREGRKLAGRPYTEVSAPIAHLDAPEALGQAAVLNRENTLRVLDGFIAVLQRMRADVEAADNESLTSRLQRAREGRERWWAQRLAADWSSPETPASTLPSASEIFGRLLGINRRQRGKE
ncbi:MAG: prephenate dehydrogenase [Anaerolineae bacterium]|nr:MAG: prephenate dehydrogenase [Anaerolineae bacterium]